MNIEEIYIRGKKSIGNDLLPYIIAEIGTNHNQDLNTAIKMLEFLKKSGVDCAKFQIYEPDEIVSNHIRASEYGLDKIYGNISAVEMFDKHLKTPKKWFPNLKERCHELGMDFAVTIHGEDGLDWVQKIGVDFVKIASMDHTNTPFLKKLVNQIRVPIIASLGMARLVDVERIFHVLKNHKPGFALMHCSAVYPPTDEELRLENISYLVNQFPVNIGFSDHSEGIHHAEEAMIRGATFFEKHFTLDKLQSGPDHPFAMEPVELDNYVFKLKNNKEQRKKITADFVDPSGRELNNRFKYLKSIIAKYDYPKGHVLNENDIYFARPATGIPPYDLDRVLGKKLKKRVLKGDILQFIDL